MSIDRGREKETLKGRRGKRRRDGQMWAQCTIVCYIWLVSYIWLDDVFIAFDGFNKASVVERRQVWWGLAVGDCKRSHCSISRRDQVIDVFQDFNRSVCPHSSSCWMLLNKPCVWLISVLIQTSETTLMIHNLILTSQQAKCFVEDVMHYFNFATHIFLNIDHNLFCMKGQI